MRYRKRPLVVEAVRYAGDGNIDRAHDPTVPDWIWEAFETDKLRPTGGADPLIVETLEGPITVPAGWWIIRGVAGELYPCDPDVFAATYDPEPAEDGSSHGPTAPAGPPILCERCGQPFERHAIYHDTRVEPAGAVEAVFPDVPTSGFYCPPGLTYRLPAALLQPGDRLDGGQVADGVGQTVAHVHDDPFADNDADGHVGIELTDGRTFLVAAARPLATRRP